MRLSERDIEIIKKATKKFFGENASVYLFGSRTDDSKKGGDIDLYIETNVFQNIIDRKIKMLAELHKELGEQKIDIIINNFSSKKFIYHVAKSEGIRL
ncbi:MAG: nucleotidyltransferase domain-containing protein [Melioribacter sp.]|uniref:nucleotidyltransferase domain-containing protein n=1 Tax=Melioribacter sp. TaxID=2052167 RepID=UPI003BDA19E3